MKHDKFCEYHGEGTFYTRPCTCEFIAKVRNDESSRWIAAITDRIEDLRSCHKNDDCDAHAYGAALALDDGINATKRGEVE